jgi:hypothetical protein
MANQLGVLLYILNVPITGSFHYYKRQVSALDLISRDMVLSFDETFAIVVHDLGMNVYLTGNPSDQPLPDPLSHAYGLGELGVSWGTGGKRIGISSNDGYVYVATEGVLDLAGEGYVMSGRKIRNFEDGPVVGSATDLPIDLPDDIEPLVNNVLGTFLSYKDVAVAGNKAHFVLTMLTLIPDLPHGLHLTVGGSLINCASLLTSTTHSTPLNIEMSNGKVIYVTNSDGGYIDQIVGDRLLGFLGIGKVTQLADAGLDNPTTFALSSK